MNNRITITPFEVSDAFALSDMMQANRSRFERYLPKTLDQNKSAVLSAEYILRKHIELEKKKGFTFKLTELKTGKIAGLIILKNINIEKRQGEIAYGIAASFEGNGFTTQAVGFICDFAFEILKLETLQIIAHKTNIGSCRVAEKNGFQWKKTLKNEFIPENDLPQDMELYERYFIP